MPREARVLPTLMVLFAGVVLAFVPAPPEGYAVHMRWMGWGSVATLVMTLFACVAIWLRPEQRRNR